MDVDIINLDTRHVIFSNGDAAPITNFFDSHGDECGPDDAVSIVAGRDEIGWWSLEILHSDRVGIN